MLEKMNVREILKKRGKILKKQISNEKTKI